MSIVKCVSHDAVAAGRRQPTRRDALSLAVKVRKVDNTNVFRGKIDGFLIEKRQLEPFLELNSVEFHA
jgi:hypothetical protein